MCLMMTWSLHHISIMRRGVEEYENEDAEEYEFSHVAVGLSPSHHSLSVSHRCWARGLCPVSTGGPVSNCPLPTVRPSLAFPLRASGPQGLIRASRSHLDVTGQVTPAIRAHCMSSGTGVQYGPDALL